MAKTAEVWRGRSSAGLEMGGWGAKWGQGGGGGGVERGKRTNLGSLYSDPWGENSLIADPAEIHSSQVLGHQLVWRGGMGGGGGLGWHSGGAGGSLERGKRMNLGEALGSQYTDPWGKIVLIADPAHSSKVL